MSLTAADMITLLDQVQLRGICSGWSFKMGHNTWDDGYIQVQHIGGECNHGGGPMDWTGRKWKVSQHMTSSEFVQTAFMAVMAAVEHEVREGFKFRGLDIFNPHMDLEALVEFRLNKKLSARTPPS